MKTIDERMAELERESPRSRTWMETLELVAKQLTEQAAEWRAALNEAANDRAGMLKEAKECNDRQYNDIKMLTIQVNNYREELAEQRGEAATLADDLRKEWKKAQDEARRLEEDLKAAKLLGVKSVQAEAGNWEFFKEKSLATIANLEARLAEDEAEHAAQLEHVETELMKSHNRDTDDLRGRYQHLVRKLVDLLLDAS